MTQTNQTNQKATNRDKYECRMMEMRAVENGEKMTIEGYAIVFDQPATHGDFTETIAKGALDGADMSNVPLRYNHNDSVMVMARTKNGSLRFATDDYGLKITADLIDTQSNRDLYKSIQEGLIDKMSFAFTVADGGDEWKFHKDGSAERTVTQIAKMYDVSVVDAPFYEGTSIYARSLEIMDVNKRQVDAKRAEEIEILKQKILAKGKV